MFKKNEKDEALMKIRDSKRYQLAILFWVIIIIVSAGGSSLLSSSTKNDTQFANTSTESGKGYNLIQERFNDTSLGVTHLIVFQLDGTTGDNLTATKWINYGYALTLYLNNSLYNIDNTGKGYKEVFSPQLLLKTVNFIPDPAVQAQTRAIALSLFSDTQLESFMQFTSTDYEANTQAQFEFLGTHVKLMRDLIANHDALYQFAINLGLTSADMPSYQQLDHLHVYVTGEIASQYDNRVVMDRVFANSEITAMIFVIVILFLVFRSPVGVAIPLVAMIGSLLPAYLGTYILGEKLGLFSVSSFLPSIIAMIGIAVAVDYNLFSMVRYREEFRKRKAEHLLNGTWNKDTLNEVQIAASKKMNQTAGQAVTYSGFTVIIGFMSFLLLGSDFTLGMAIGVSVVVVFSILTARTLTPAILGLFGRFLDWPNILSRADQEVEQYKHEIKHEETRVGFWTKWTRMVMKRSVLFLLIGILFLTPFIIYSTQTKLSFDTLTNLPKGTESRDGFEVIYQKFDLGASNPYQVVIDTGDTSVFTDAIFTAVNNLASWALSGNTKFAGGASVTFDINVTNGNLVPYTVQQSLLRMNMDPRFDSTALTHINFHTGNNTMIVDFYANLDSGSSEAWNLAQVLRGKAHEYLDGVPGVKGIYVTGFQALFSDTKNDMYSGVPLMILFATVLIYLALLVLFRSVIIPAKAIVTIAGSILFGLGSLVFIFQKGHLNHIEIFGHILWETERSSGLMFFIPIFIFTTILGLGMDYSIFILSRIKEEYDKSGDIEEAVGIGLSKTAGVITSAAAIMVGTFMVFAISPILIIRTFGFALAVSILVDATVARIIIIPAAMKLLGKWNWYIPKWLERILPEVHLEH